MIKLKTMQSRVIALVAVLFVTITSVHSFLEYRSKLDFIVQGGKTLAELQYKSVKELIDEHGMSVTSEKLKTLQKKYGFNISVVVPDGKGFKYLAKTHKLTIPKKIYPWLHKVMKAEKPLFRRLNKNNKELITYYAQVRNKSGKSIGIVAIPRNITSDMDRLYREALYTVIMVLCSMCVLFIVLKIFLGRMLNKPLNDILSFFKQAGQGEYNKRLGRYPVEIGLLATGINSLMDTVEAVLDKNEEEQKNTIEQAEYAKLAVLETEEQNKQVRSLVERMSIMAQSIADISDQLAEADRKLTAELVLSRDGLNEQKIQSSSLAHSMERMKDSSSKMAGTATGAAEQAETAKTKAESGAVIVAEVVNSTADLKGKAEELKDNMTELQELAGNISKIVIVIGDIADQTNLLALNAAIEAARAGESGRGFAVVADEVRKLAEKTVQATNEVEDAVNKIQDGTGRSFKNTEQAVLSISANAELSSRSGDVLHEIVDISVRTADQVKTIASVSEQLSFESMELSDATLNISNIAERNTESMSICSEVVEGINDLTDELRKLINEMRSID
nr:methyl-accepting chemotaxis protein [Maridesulfovibrio zosterae]